MKRLSFLAIACFFAVSSAFAAWDGSTQTEWTTGSGTEEDPYLIESEENLASLAAQVNAGQSFSGKYFKQTADLDLGCVFDEAGIVDTEASENFSWTPIGNKSACFSGIYDGNGFVISNLYYNNIEQEYCGLFGGINNAKLKNITLVSGFVFGYQYAGGICGYAKGSSLVDCCANNATVYGKMERNGGVVGYIEGTTQVNNCINYGFVSAFNFSGGVVGFCNKTTTTVANCVNVGQVFSMRCTAGSLYGYNKDFGGLASNNYYDKQVNHSEGWTSVTNIIEKNVDVVGKVEGKSTAEMLGDGLKDALGDTYWEYSDGLYPRLKLSKDNDAIVLAATPVVLEQGEDVDNVKTNFSVNTSNDVVWANTTENIVSVSGNNVTINGNGPVQLIAKKGNYTKTFALRTNAEETYPTLSVDNIKDMKDLIFAMAYSTSYKGYANYNGFKGVNFVLNDNLSFMGSYDEETDTWSGSILGYMGVHNSFKGNFDGQNHNIENVYVDMPAAINGGLFGCVSYGTISNLNITSGYVTTGKQHAGGLAGASFLENFINCSVNCTVTAGTAQYAAGIVSYDKGFSTFTNCKNYGNVTSSQYSGGFVAKSDIATTVEGCENWGYINVGASGKAGGFCGTSNISMAISNSRNYGAIEGPSLVGGFIGQSSANGAIISNSENHGAITGTSSIVAGFIGQSTKGHITNCINNAKVTGTTSIGGICGESTTDTIQFCINNDTIMSSSSVVGGIAGVIKTQSLINGCLNSSYVKGASNIGGICGQTTESVVKNCFNSGLVNANTNIGGGIVGSNGTQSECESSINIGLAISGGANKGAIVGSNSGSVNYCYSDKQISTNTKICEGTAATNSELAFTKDIISDNLKDVLGEDNWSYANRLYPCPKGLENNEIAQVATASICLFVDENDENLYDELANVSNKFSIGFANGVKWKSSSNIIGIVNYDAYVSQKDEENTVTLTATKGTISKSLTLTIPASVGLLSPNLNWDGIADFVYGTAIDASMLNATVDEGVDGVFVYSVRENDILPAGSQEVTVTFAPTTPGYALENKTITVNVAKAQPVITWNKPSDIIYGTRISSEQQNAVCNVDGEFIYTNTGAVLDAGTHKLYVTFNPSNNNYTSVKDSVELTINKATPTIVWANPSDITYGEAISSQLNAISTTEGEITYSVNVGDVLSAGDNTITATLTPTSGNYETTSATVVLHVRKAASAITWAPEKTRFTYGESIELLFNASADAEGSIVYSVDKTATPNAGSLEVTATFTPASGNYESATKGVNVNIEKAKLSVSVADAKIKQGENLPSFNVEYNGFVNNDNAASLKSEPTATCSTDGKTAGTFDIVVAGGESSNYDFVYQNGKLTVEKTDAIAETESTINIYPNPTTDVIVIESDANEAQIFNLNGDLVKVCPLSGTTHVDVNDLAEGTYIVVVGNKATRIVKK